MKERMVLRMAKNHHKIRCISEKQIEWAYEKWCNGYSMREIADALYVSLNVVHRAFLGRPKNKPKLVYEGSVKDDA